MEEDYQQQTGGGAADLVLALWRRKWLPPLCLVVVVVPVLFYVKYRPDVYASHARVLVDIKTRPHKVLNTPEMGGSFDSQTELEIVKSEEILAKGRNVLDVAGADADWLREADFDIARGSRVMAIATRGPTPELARDVANALANAYVEHRRRMRINETRDTLAWLHEQLADAKTRVLQAEESFQTFKKNNGIPSLENKHQADLQRHQTLSEAYIQAQKLRLEAEAELRAFEASLQAQRPPPEAEAKRGADQDQGKAGAANKPEAAGQRTPAAAPAKASDQPVGKTPVDKASKTEAPKARAAGARRPPPTRDLAVDNTMDPSLREMALAIRQKEVQLKDLSERFKEPHPAIVKLKRDIELLRERFHSEKERSEQRRLIVLQRRLDTLRRAEEQAEKALKDWRNQLLVVTDVAVEYRILEREAQSARASHDLIAGKIRELTFASASSDDTAKVLDEAQVGQLVPAKGTRNIVLAVFGGLALSVMVCILLERLDTSIKSPEDVERYLGLPVVGIIPRLPNKAKRREKLVRQRRKALLAAQSSSA